MITKLRLYFDNKTKKKMKGSEQITPTSFNISIYQ